MTSWVRGSIVSCALGGAFVLTVALPNAQQAGQPAPAAAGTSTCQAAGAGRGGGRAGQGQGRGAQPGAPGAQGAQSGAGPAGQGAQAAAAAGGGAGAGAGARRWTSRWRGRDAAGDCDGPRRRCPTAPSWSSPPFAHRSLRLVVTRGVASVGHGLSARGNISLRSARVAFGSFAAAFSIRSRRRRTPDRGARTYGLAGHRAHPRSRRTSRRPHLSQAQSGAAAQGPAGRPSRSTAASRRCAWDMGRKRR